MMAEDKKILEAPKKVVDGLVEVFEGLAQMFSGVSDQLEKIPLLAADPEDEIPRPLAEVPALSEKKGAAAPHPRKKPVKKIRKAEVPVDPLHASRLFFHISQQSLGSAEVIIHALAADPKLLGNFTERQVLIVAHIHTGTLALCKQLTVVIKKQCHFQCFHVFLLSVK